MALGTVTCAERERERREREREREREALYNLLLLTVFGVTII